MKQLKDISQLTPGCVITRIHNGEFQTWEYLMYHPHKLISSTSPTCWSVDFIGSANTILILSYGKESDNVSVISKILKPV